MRENQITPSGPSNAKIFICGECPGEQEVKEGKPFVGPAGRVLDGLLRDAGIVREQCYITNVLLWRPDGEFTKLYGADNAPSDELSAAIRALELDIQRIQPNIVVCLGEHANRAVTGNRGITYWRGSVVRGRHGGKCIATIHPASIAREWTQRPAALADFRKVLRESAFPEIRRKDRQYTILYPDSNRVTKGRGEVSRTGTEHSSVESTAPLCSSSPSLRRELPPTSGEVDRRVTDDGKQGSTGTGFQTESREVVPGECTTSICSALSVIIAELDSIKGAEYVAFDIETESNQITAIALSPSNRPNWAICIPFWFGSSGSLWEAEDELILWGKIREILTDPGIGKIAHNAAYDIEFIDRVMGFKVTPLAFDTMLGMHTLYLELPKALAFAVSLYTDHPYYKGDIHSTDMEVYFRYNATDACLTMEIATKLMQELKEEGLWEFYNGYVHSLVEPLLAMSKKGVRFDYLKKNSIKKRLQEEVAVLQKQLDAAVGRPINTNSPKQMKEWLYNELKYKAKTKKSKLTGEEAVTADNEALEELYKEHQNEALLKVLKIREKNKVISTYLEVKLDEDKRIRCSYNITGTETGRLSSSATACGTGTNLQNVPAGPVKTLFLPDEGYTLINADLSQAEARVVAYLANESRLIRVFEEGGDIHRKNASNIFRVPEANVTDEQRQLAKRVVHASNYGMGPITFAKQCGIPASEAKRLLNQYFATYPGIANWQLDIASQLRNKRYLVTPFGRKRVFFNRFNDSLTKEGFAYIPQSTVADIVGQALVCAHQKGIELLLQVHDSLLVQAPTGEVDQVCRMLKECLTVPLEINGKILVIPVDVKIGQNWNDMEKWKGV